MGSVDEEWRYRKMDRSGPVQGVKFPISPLNRPICARFGVVARWDFQERVRLILPNEDGGCKRFLCNLAAHFWSPPDAGFSALSSKSGSNEKKMKADRSDPESVVQRTSPIRDWPVIGGLSYSGPASRPVPSPMDESTSRPQSAGWQAASLRFRRDTVG